MRRGEHGGDWAAYQIQYHGMPLDFSANVSPMGVPAGVKRALYQAVEEVNRYPDPLCRPSAEAGGLSSGGVFPATGRGFSGDSADFGAHYACIGYFISL